jgi:hypothetical protein
LIQKEARFGVQNGGFRGYSLKRGQSLIQKEAGIQKKSEKDVFWRFFGKPPFGRSTISVKKEENSGEKATKITQKTVKLSQK